MKPPEGLLPLRSDGIHIIPNYMTSRSSFQPDRKAIKEESLWIVEACNSYEATQAELERLKKELAFEKSVHAVMTASATAFHASYEKMVKERAETLIELRRIADALEYANINGKSGAISKVDALLVKLGDLPAAYAKTGGEG